MYGKGLDQADIDMLKTRLTEYKDEFGDKYDPVKHQELAVRDHLLDVENHYQSIYNQIKPLVETAPEAVDSPTVDDNVEPIPKGAVEPPGDSEAPGVGVEILDFAAPNVDENGNWILPGDALRKELSNRSDEEIVSLMKWATGQSAHVNRNVTGEGAAVLRERNVPVDEIGWQQDNLKQPQPKQEPPQGSRCREESCWS